MTIDSPGDVTRCLREIAAGNQQAEAELFACVYEELRDMAKRERPNPTLGTTGLVHEVYLRIRRGQALRENRAYFFGAAARAMYRIVVERARLMKNRQHRVPFDAIVTDLEAAQKVSVLDLDEALQDLAHRGDRGRRQHDVIIMRFFGGLAWRDIAQSLGVAIPTVEKDWQAARAWLFRRLRAGEKE